MDLNLIKILFLFNTFVLTVLGFLIRIAEPYLPIEIIKLFRHGKFATKRKTAELIPAIEIPKRWFKHFYAFAAPASTYILLVASLVYMGIATAPNHICKVLDILLGVDRKPLVSPEHTILAIILITIQCWKRFYETHYVSVFSDGKMNLGHYGIGYFHYFGTLSCLIGESEGFVEGTDPTFNWNRLKLADYVCAFLFLLASYTQLSSNVILANLRKNKTGQVVTFRYTVPKGGLFYYISSPLQFTEIIMYLMLTVILWNSSSYHYVSFWVLINQMATGLFSHWWYVDTFKDYPKQRKALIPYVL